MSEVVSVGRRAVREGYLAEENVHWMLDLFACEGIGGEGYHRAGWEVEAVELDRNRARRNPFTTYVTDALEFVAEHGHKYDAIHASPPCQWYTRGNAARRGTATKWERTIPPVREALQATGKPYIIENVADAAWDMIDPVTLCGCMFDLSTTDTDGVRLHLRRQRLFETNWGLTAPRPCHHPAGQQIAGAYGGARRDKAEARNVRKGGYVPPDKEVVKALLGVKHDTTWAGLFECIPPAYTEWIGQELFVSTLVGENVC